MRSLAIVSGLVSPRGLSLGLGFSAEKLLVDGADEFHRNKAEVIELKQGHLAVAWVFAGKKSPKVIDFRIVDWTLGLIPKK